MGLGAREGDAVLIAAQSGRALAQAARRAGLRPFVLDLFGDEDTLALADAHRILPGRFGSGRPDAAVLPALDALAGDAGSAVLGVVLGSGFEGAPDLIAAIAARHRLFGAAPETVAALKDPHAFAALCARLAIPHPRVSSDRVAEPATWLLKRRGGSGGSHIRPAGAGGAPPGHYLQERVPGQPHALALLCDGRNAAVLALTEQWSAPSPLRQYRFAGAVAPGRGDAPVLPAAMLAAITEGVARLVAQTGLRGLASADLLVDGESWWLLEINPRPGATLDLLDRRTRPLLAAHIEACLGHLPELGPSPPDAAGCEICYAPRRYAAVPPVVWPDFVRDRPRAGSVVGRDAPLCTVTATGPDRDSVRALLRERAAAIAARLERGEDHHGRRHQVSERQRVDGAARRAARA